MQIAGSRTKQWLHKHFTPTQTPIADVNWRCCMYISPVAFSKAGLSDLRSADFTDRYFSWG